MTIKLSDPHAAQPDAPLLHVANILGGCADVPLPDPPVLDVAADGLPTVDDPSTQRMPTAGSLCMRPGLDRR